MSDDQFDEQFPLQDMRGSFPFRRKAGFKGAIKRLLDHNGQKKEVTESCRLRPWFGLHAPKVGRPGNKRPSKGVADRQSSPLDKGPSIFALRNAPRPTGHATENVTARICANFPPTANQKAGFFITAGAKMLSGVLR